MLELLPDLVWSVLADYLSSQDLLSLSAVSRGLRTVLNNDQFWRTHCQGGRALSNIPCQVEPVFTIPSGSALDPLCECRIHLLRQSHLLTNLRRGKWVHHSLTLPREMELLEDQNGFGNWRVTFEDVYLFLAGHNFLDDGVVFVYNIESAPYLVTSFTIPNHGVFERRFNARHAIHIVGNKLVVFTSWECQCWVDVYEIRISDKTFPHLHYIKISESARFYSVPVILGRFFFAPIDDEALISVWDLETGEKIKDIHPPIEGPNFSLRQCNTDSKKLLMTIGYESETRSPFYIFGYDIEAMKFSNFTITLDLRFSGCLHSELFEGCLVIMISAVKVNEYLVSVYDYKTSCLLRKRAIASSLIREGDPTVINGSLVIPSKTKVDVLDLNNLKTLWQIPICSEGSIQNEILLNYYVALSTTNHIIVLHTTENKSEVWEFEQRIKLFDLPFFTDTMYVNESSTRMVSTYFDNKCSENSDITQIISFW